MFNIFTEEVIMSNHCKRKSKTKKSEKYKVSKFIFDRLYIFAIVVVIIIGLIFYFNSKPKSEAINYDPNLNLSLANFALK